MAYVPGIREVVGGSAVTWGTVAGAAEPHHVIRRQRTRIANGIAREARVTAGDGLKMRATGAMADLAAHAGFGDL
jgi:hypothetical protein